MQFLSGFEAKAGCRVFVSDIVEMHPYVKDIADIEIQVPADGRQLSAAELAYEVAGRRPDIQPEILGSGDIFISRPAHMGGIKAILAKICLLLILFSGAAMGMAFFHADVNMNETQRAIIRAMGGAELKPLEMALPYSLGVLAGVSGFFLLGGRDKSPLAIKLKEYRSQLEKAGRPAAQGADAPRRRA